ncbi:MAG: DUF3788 domain-containing protein [Bacteroidota bacterium]|nr:DUF3788 domain-containing protein [Bacteroidota bacterium]
MDKSVFTNKAKAPTEKDLVNALGNAYLLWQDIFNFVYLKYPAATNEWNFPGEKYGWSFRIKDKKRAIIYLLPRDQFFKVALVFGQKAFEEIIASKVSAKIKRELESAKVYAEGRGIRLEVKDKKILKDITRLIEIKLAH